MKAKIVVFDVGAVLIDWDPENLYRKLIPDDAERDYFLTHITPRIWNAHQDLGLTWPEAIEKRISIYPEYADLIRAYYDRWPEMVKGAIAGTVAIKAKLREGGIPVYAITNFNQDTWRLSQKLWPFLTEFDGIIVSGEEKMLKPDPAIYTLLCQRYNLNPADCLFIDDVPANVAGAKSAGMDAHLFTTPEALAQTLETYPQLKFKAQ
jgi:2-haloacid dehalogenase